MKNRKFIKKVLIVLTLFMIIFTIYEIINIYAVFYSETKGNINTSLANWNIELNGNEISNGIIQEFVMDNFNIEPNDNTKEGKIAPGMVGNFSISINPKDTQVSIKYDISIDKSNINNNEIELISVEEVNSNNEIIKTGEYTYTGIIPLSCINNNYLDIIQITFCWSNNEENNKQDTQLGTIVNSKLQIPISINIVQYLGEQIIPYTE